MRINKPTTNEEYVLRECAAIVSRTNLKGVITDCNDEFIEASGFSRDELIGQPHNLVRHPDVPPAAFRDLWDTVRRGRPWVGIVKNRRKNGGFYWVHASVTPLPTGDGYSSVRTKPTNDEIASAEALYKRLTNDESIRLLEGTIVGAGVLSRIHLKIKSLSITNKLRLIGVISNLFLLGSFFVGAQAIITNASESLSIEQKLEILLSHSHFHLLVVILVSSFAITSVMTTYIINRLNRSLKDAGQATKAIASGDLVRPMPPTGTDEIGTLLAQIAIMRNSLHELIATIRQNVDVLENSSQELTQAAISNANASEAQSTSATSMASTVEQLSVSVDMVEENAKQAYTATQVSFNRSSEGAQIINEAADVIERIAESVHSTAETIRDLESYSVQISSITSVIKEIADQTNLLALNAAIEAARAGEQGRGFAVVADEVRKLAERTSNSTEEISAMISKIQRGTQRAAVEMEAAVDRVGDGVNLARQAGDSMVQIQQDATLVMNSVEEISGALQEQVSAAREIAQRVEQIATVSESSSSVASETAASAQRLEALSHRLHNVTTVFRIS